MTRVSHGRTLGRSAGAEETALADDTTFPGLELAVRRVSLAPRASYSLRAPRGETMAYVVRGTGTATSAATAAALEPEALLWLDPGDELRIEAGAAGAELLLAHAAGTAHAAA